MPLLEYLQSPPNHISLSQIKNLVLQDITIMHHKPPQNESVTPFDTAYRNREKGHLYVIPKRPPICDNELDKDEVASRHIGHEYLFVLGGIETFSSPSTSATPCMARLLFDQIGTIQFHEGSWFSNPSLSFHIKEREAFVSSLVTPMPQSEEHFLISLNDREKLLKFKKEAEAILNEMEMERNFARQKRRLTRSGSTLSNPELPVSSVVPRRKRRRNSERRRANDENPCTVSPLASDATLHLETETSPKKHNLTPINTRRRSQSLQGSRTTSRGQCSDDTDKLSASPNAPRTPSQLTRYLSTASDSPPAALASSALPPSVVQREVKRLQQQVAELETRLELQREELQREREEVQQELIVTQIKLKSASQCIEELRERYHDDEIHLETIRKQSEEIDQCKRDLEMSERDTQSYRVKNVELLRNIEELQKSNSQLKEAFEIQSNSSLKTQLDDAYSMIGMLQSQVTEAQQQSRAWKEKYDAMVALLEGERTVVQHQREMLATTQHLAISLEHRIAQMKQEMETLRSALNQSMTEMTEQSSSLNGEINNLHEELTNEHALNTQLLLEKGELVQKVERLESEIEKFCVENAVLAEQRLALERELNKHRMDHENLGAQIQKLVNDLRIQQSLLSEEKKRLHTTMDSLRDTETLLQDKEVQVHQLTERMNALLKELKSKEDDHAAHTLHLQDKLQHNLEQMKTLRREKDSSIALLRQSLLDWESKYDAEIGQLKALITTLEAKISFRDRTIQHNNAGNQLIASRLRRQIQMAQAECTEHENRAEKLERDLRHVRKLNTCLRESYGLHESMLEEYRKTIAELSDTVNVLEEETAKRAVAFSNATQHAEALILEYERRYDLQLRLSQEYEQKSIMLEKDLSSMRSTYQQKEIGLITQMQMERDALRDKIQTLRKEQIGMLAKYEAEIELYHQSRVSKQVENDQTDVLSSQVQSLRAQNDKLTHDIRNSNKELLRVKDLLIASQARLREAEKIQADIPLMSAHREKVVLLEEKLVEIEQERSLLRRELDGAKQKAQFWQSKATNASEGESAECSHSTATPKHRDCGPR